MNRTKRIPALLLTVILVVSMFLITPKAVFAASKLNTPIMQYYIDGKNYVIFWDAIPNAAYYTFTIDGKETNTTDTGLMINAIPGTTYTCTIQAISNSKAYTSSDIRKFSITYPKITYSKLNPAPTVLLSMPQLKEWADTNSYQSEVIEEKDYTIFHIIMEDELNNKKAYKIGRGAAGLLDGGIQGIKKGIKEVTLDGVVSDSLKNYWESGSKRQAAKDTIKGTASEIAFEGMIGAISSAKTYLSQDTNKHYYYYYPNNKTDYSAVQMVSVIETMYRENYKRLTEEALNKTSDGLYYNTFDAFNRNVIIDINEVETETLYTKWVTTMIPIQGAAK